MNRREALRRIGAGAAVAWSAPVVTSLSTPAWAAYPECPICRPFDCETPFPECGGGECLCIETTENDCFCASTILCGPCEKSSDCGPDRRCVVSTCSDPCGRPGGFCANPCPF